MSSPDIDAEVFIGLIGDWGQGSVHDLNCDGTVDTQDFLQMLADLADATVQSEIDALFAEWGQGSKYDFDCDGVVDTADWLILLSSPEIDAMDYIGMLADWGTGSVYDLNCDGTVDTQDYLVLLSDIAEEIAQNNNSEG